MADARVHDAPGIFERPYDTRCLLRVTSSDSKKNASASSEMSSDQPREIGLLTISLRLPKTVDYTSQIERSPRTTADES